MKLLLAAAAIVFAVLVFEVFFPGIKTLLRSARTSMRLSMLPSSEYIVVSGIPLGSDGKSSNRIDYAVVSSRGIFVIQEKPYGGRIFGKANEERWTRQVFGKEHAFRNPLIRSSRQISALSSLLNLDPSVFIPVIVFSGGGSAWVDTTVPIIPGFRLRNTILSYTEQRLSTDEVQDAAITLSEMAE